MKFSSKNKLLFHHAEQIRYSMSQFIGDRNQSRDRDEVNILNENALHQEDVEQKSNVIKSLVYLRSSFLEQIFREIR
jgi:hypothetical protein